ncbi:MAG: recombination regulator RecX [Legionellales bacterium RIFCSPHIGHO2_12_FULL_35_11]|nr:MAG: recombination regulator RecX [Legionellales bacterium RIFCSPHIGHO2_12_FULL_35_11]
MSKAYQSAIGLLARREHSVSELRAKLESIGYSFDEVTSVLSRLKNLELQSDERFVDMVCRSRINQGYGPIRVHKELQQKGVDTELIESRLAIEHENWVSYATAVWQKKFYRQREYSYSEIQKQKKFLLYRGFTMDTISLVFENLA